MLQKAPCKEVVTLLKQTNETINTLAAVRINLQSKDERSPTEIILGVCDQLKPA